MHKTHRIGMERKQCGLTDAHHPGPPSGRNRRMSNLDVFGGPPVRSPGSGGRRHRDSSATRYQGIQVEHSPLLWRRGHLADDDFFDDIFLGGDDPASSSGGSHNCPPRHASSGRLSSLPSCSEKLIDQPGIPASCSSFDDIVLAKKYGNSTDTQRHAAANIRRHFKEGSTNLASDKRISRSSYFFIFKSACSSDMLPVPPASQGRIQSSVASGNEDVRKGVDFQNFFPRNLLRDDSESRDGKQDVKKEGVFDAPDSSRSDNNVEIKVQKGESVGVQSDDNEITISLEDKVNLSRFREKIKYFLKNFHQVFSCKHAKYFEPRSRTFKVREEENNKVEGAQVSKVDVDIEDKKGSGRAQSNASKLMEEIPRQVEQESSSFILHEVSAAPQEDGLEIENIDSILENIDEICAGSEEVRGKIEGMNADLTLKEWYFGKERNIRSLLSTLQYVLWPGSGWKPLHLQDLVECRSVKKAYLKAMLTLHPDKLQQRDVPTHYKYIAEKVFDILQEAWSEFTSISRLN